MRLRTRRAAAAFLSSAIAAIIAPAPAGAAPLCGMAAVSRTLDSKLQGVAKRPDLPGISVALGTERHRWAKGYGHASLELRSAMKPETKLRIGSVSKVYATAALMRLVQAGSVDLDSPIGRYLPDYPAHARSVTVRQLASHLGGIRHVVKADSWLGIMQTWDEAHVLDYPTTEAALAIFKDDALVSPPGERQHYSSYAWTIISAVLERASGKPFLRLMEEGVFRPLRLEHSIADLAKQVVPDRASFYIVEKPNVIEPAPPINMSAIWAAGGYLSTPSDMVSFALAHKPGAFFDARTLDSMWTLQKARVGPSEYGIGWNLDMRDFIENALIPSSPAQAKRLTSILARLPKIAYHTGSSRGAFSLLVYAPGERVAASFAANVNGNVDPSYVELFADVMEAFLLLTDRTGRCPR